MAHFSSRAAVAALCVLANVACAQPSANTVTYQGVLTQNGAPVADGSYSLVFKIYDTAVGGNPIQTINVPGVPTTQGRFSAAVPVPPSRFDGADRWWSVTFAGTELPRQKVTATPYALRSLTASSLELRGSPTSLTIDPGRQSPEAGFVYFGDGSGWKLHFNQRLDAGGEDSHWFDDRGNQWSAGVLTNVGANCSGPVTVRSGNTTGYVQLAGVPNAGGRVLLAAGNPSQDGLVDIFVRNDGGNSFSGRIELNDRNGRRTTLAPTQIATPVIQITGADVAEKFDVASASQSASQSALHPVPGMVVSIDPANPGKLMIAAEAYDKKVAGIISGANGLDAGVILGQDNKSPYINGEHPVAMTGRVWVFADDSNGPIIPGDRLTSSGIKPGHAMKALDESKAPGAVIGKAMTPRDDKTGMALVLVNLQ